MTDGKENTQEYIDYDNFSQNIFYYHCNDCNDVCELKNDVEIAGCWIRQQVGNIIKNINDEKEEENNFSKEFCKTNK